MIKINERPKVLRWVFLSVCILLAAHPARSQVHPPPRGPQVLKFVEKDHQRYQVVTFDELFFNYAPPVAVEHPDGNVTPAAKVPMTIPKDIQDLSGKKVAVTGFVIPLASQGFGQNTKEFLFADELVSCLFCAMLGYDQWMIGDTVDPKGFNISDDDFNEPITIYGTLNVGPKFEDGEFAGIYRIKADAFEVQKKKLFGIF
ncbi:MAG: hypothetical protein KGJ09_02430 [Candidatus Omnitrophica bacterium]|nr:hypothetical protein [Candidatus Omnitrophota bacterium]MDE2008915.1 hypothetical protein [Candidatus Omnitrophota bacterium]MDE2213522.1 hypothetical protein [Candidatus Omnitrophota bacterium]MDE2230577.1 hypothetical protein [Candidatus Omnitrophota bacterium]